MPSKKDYDFSFRCPRCNGFLYIAEKFDCPMRLDRIKNGKIKRNYFSKMFVCINCGRIWYLDNKELHLYPQGISEKEFAKKR